MIKSFRKGYYYKYIGKKPPQINNKNRVMCGKTYRCYMVVNKHGYFDGVDNYSAGFYFEDEELRNFIEISPSVCRLIQIKNKIEED